MSNAIHKKDITMIKSMAAPPQLVKEELACTALLLGLSERQAKVCLSDLHVLCSFFKLASATICIYARLTL